MEQKRLESLDAFRGFDMMFIMGFASIITAVCSLFPGGENCFLVQQMEHVEWDGLAFMDLIFPTFLFIAGISFPFSYAKQQACGLSRGQMHWKAVRRALLLMLCGLLYNGILSTGNLANFRYCSVLGRIGFAWMFAAILFMNCGRLARIVVAAALLAVYFVVIRFIPAPDAAGADTLSQAGNIAGWIDRKLMPGRLYLGNWDPEGILGIVPATVTAMLGMFTGEFVRSRAFDGKRKTLYMFGAAAVLAAAGLIWNIWFPINKNLWSSSFVLMAAAIALAGFATFFYIIDVKGHHGPFSFFCRMFGMNSITIYLASAFIPFGTIARNLLDGVMSLCSEQVAHLILVCGMFALRWLLVYFLYRKKLFLKV